MQELCTYHELGYKTGQTWQNSNRNMSHGPGVMKHKRTFTCKCDLYYLMHRLLVNKYLVKFENTLVHGHFINLDVLGIFYYFKF